MVHMCSEKIGILDFPKLDFGICGITADRITAEQIVVRVPLKATRCKKQNLC